MRNLEKIALNEFRELTNAELRMTRGGVDPGGPPMINCASASTIEECEYYVNHNRCGIPEYYDTPGYCEFDVRDSHCKCRVDFN